MSTQNIADLLQDEVERCNMICSLWKWKLTFTAPGMRFFPVQIFLVGWLIGCLFNLFFVCFGFSLVLFYTLDVLFVLANDVFFLMKLYV